MITVVIPVRNRAAIVARTLDSIAAQTLAPDAVVLVDNASTDNTLAVLRGWAESRPSVEVVEELRPGAARARNAGLERVKSPYVMFFDSDDVMPRRHIEQVTAGLKCAGLPDVGAFDMELVGVDGVKSMKPFRRGDAMKMHIFHSTLSTQRCVVSTELARRVGGWNNNLGGWDDLEFGVRLLAAKPTLSYLPLTEPVMAIAQVESITGVDFSSKAGEWERALDACEEVLRHTPYRRMIDYRRAILAGMYRREGHAELGHGLARGFRMKLIERYVAMGGRGVAYLA